MRRSTPRDTHRSDPSGAKDASRVVPDAGTSFGWHLRENKSAEKGSRREYSVCVASQSCRCGRRRFSYRLSCIRKKKVVAAPVVVGRMAAECVVVWRILISAAYLVAGNRS